MRYDAVVVGGGLVGVATAYRLVREGAKTALIDRADRGRATDAGAGILPPQSNVRSSSPPTELSSRATRHYASLVEELRADEAGETGYAQCGLLVVAGSEDERVAYERTRAASLSPRGEENLPQATDVREVTPAEARRMFPPLGEILGAVYHHTAARVDGRLLSRAIKAAAERRGLIVVQGSVDRLLFEGGRAAGVTVGNTTYAAPRVAVTGGAWSGAFGDQIGMHIPVEPQRGQIIHLQMPRVDTSAWPIIEGFRGHYMVPWPGGRVAVGATRETGSGFDPRLTAAGVREVLSEALRLAPGLAQWEIHEMRVGLRPLSADGLPVLGPVPRIEGVFLATGHGPSGLHLGPYSGALVADLMLGRRPEMDLSPFHAARFLQ
jgi:D-amino-acid dehydrogenase